MMPKTFLFDLNGVLVDSERINFAVWQTIFQEKNLELNADIYDSFVDGKKTSELAGMIYNKPNCEKLLLARKDELWLDLVETIGLVAFDDAVRFLEYLRQADALCGVVSSSRKAKIILKMAGLYNYFKVIVDGESIAMGKPDPEIIFTAIKMLGTNNDNTLLFEDSESGIRAGLSAGVYTIGVRCKHDLAKSICHKNINSFDDVLHDEILNW